MHNVLLVATPLLDPSYPPVGLACIVGALQGTGISLTVLDLNIEFFRSLSMIKMKFWEPEYRQSWRNENNSTIEELKVNFVDFALSRIDEYNPSIIGFTVSDTNLDTVLLLAKAIRSKSDVFLFAGGPECYFENNAKKILNFIHFVISGEGEIEAKKVIKAYLENRLPRGRVVANQVANLDNLPRAKYSDFPLDLYTTNDLGINLSRGCIAKCAFCSEIARWPIYRYRSGASVASEMSNYVQRHGKNSFVFVDSLINGNFIVLDELCKQIKRKKMSLSFRGQARFSPKFSLERFANMAAAGCKNLQFGLESGSQRVLSLMKKGVKIEVAAQNLDNCRKVGIRATINVIVGFPGESAEDFNMTLKFIKDEVNNISGIDVIGTCVIAPGSALGRNPTYFGITDIQNPIIWRDQNSIDYEQRILRLEKLFSLICKLKIPIGNQVSVVGSKDTLDGLTCKMA